MDCYSEHFTWFFTRATGDRHLAEDLTQKLWFDVYFKFELGKFTEYLLLMRKAK